MKDIEQHKGHLANGNNGYLSDGTHVKANIRKGYASYRHKGVYGAANNYKRHDQQQVEVMEQDFSEYMNAPEQVDGNIGETDTHMCAGCKFWLWYEDERQERCSIKGCWSGSKYVPYRIGYMCGE